MKTKFNPWPYGIILFFVLLFCGMATVVAIAATHRESMVSENYYEQELKFQDRIDSAARAQKSGANIQLDAAAGKLLVAVPAAQLAQKFSGAIELYRPSASELDREFPFDAARRRHAGAGCFQARRRPLGGARQMERRRPGLFSRTENHHCSVPSVDNLK